MSPFLVTREDLGAEQNGPDSGDQKLEFTYDFVGRRVEKVYSVYELPDQTPDAWVVTSTERFVYDGWTLDTPGLGGRDTWRASPAAASQGWNVALVLDDNNDTLRKYTWGLDLGGTLHDAGGIGGLLACVETGGSHEGSYWYFYDANGNVGQVIDAGDYSIAARYEYDPYGNEVDPDPTPPDPYDDINPFRFSTKWLDTELAGSGINGAIGNTGLYYYGYRYYSARLGRWLSRDPIEEEGARQLMQLTALGRRGLLSALDLFNCYQHTGNNPLTKTDPDGRIAVTTATIIAGACTIIAAIITTFIVSDGCTEGDQKSFDSEYKCWVACAGCPEGKKWTKRSCKKEITCMDSWWPGVWSRSHWRTLPSTPSAAAPVEWSPGR